MQDADWEHLAQDALVAAGEAVASAIEHGHRDHPGQEIRLQAAVTANRLRLTVADSGRWQPPATERTPYRGKGIQRQHRTRRGRHHRHHGREDHP